MKNLIIISLTIFVFSLSACQSAGRTKNIEVLNSQSALLFTNSGIKPLKPGSYQVTNKEYAVIVQRADSIRIEEFDVLDVNAKSVFCSVTIQYTINEDQLKNIANLLTNPDHVEKYNALLIPSEIKDPIREKCFDINKDDLLSDNPEIITNLREYTTSYMNRYINISSLNITFHE